MNSAVLVIFSAFAMLCEYALTQPVKYDQRQEGDLNVRTDVEDVVFVMAMPQDLIAGMGLLAANAVDLLKKNYGGLGPERWPMRTPTKVGFGPLEKSPYKIDLEKSEIKVKKISQAGDPNRFNKNPTKATEVQVPAKIPEKFTTEVITQMTEEIQSSTESETVKKIIKLEDIKMTTASPEKKPIGEIKDEKFDPIFVKKSEEAKPTTHEKVFEEQPKLVGDSLDPTSILKIEGCGPDARRDSAGRCVYTKLENFSKEE